MNDLWRKLLQFYQQQRRFLFICRLHRPADIPLFLLPGVSASLLAAEGAPQTGPMLTLLLAALLFRCSAWVFNDLMESRLLEEPAESFIARQIVTPREAQIVLGVLLLPTVLLLLPLGLPLLYYAAGGLLLLLGFPLLKTRLLLTQPYLGICYAWLVPMAWVAQDAVPGKGAWLLFTAVLLFATGFNTLHAMQRRGYEQRVGIGSLPQLLGNNIWLFILVVQIMVVLALWLAGRELELGIFFSLALVVLLLLLPYQLWLLLSDPRHGPMRSYYSQIWSAVALFCGVAFHFICLANH